MTRIEAQPGALHGSAGRAASLASELGGLHGPLRDAANGAAGGPPGAQAAIEHSCGQWGAALTALTTRAQEMDRNLAAAAGAYTDTDNSAMPTD